MTTASVRRRITLATSFLALLTLVVACGEKEGAPAGSPSSGAPTGIVSALLTGEDLGDGWSTTAAGEFGVDGEVTDENRERLPGFEFCPDAPAPAQQAVAELHWDAFRQLDYDTGLPAPSPSPDMRPAHHLVFVQEFLMSPDGADIQGIFAGMSAGFDACVGQKETSRDGEVIRTVPLEVPAVGDQATGTRLIVTEPGGPGGAVWNLDELLVRDGNVLMALTVVEITTPGIDKVLDDQEVQRIATTAVDKLP